MKPSERIGNLLYNEKGEVVEVESITKTHINGVELSKWRPIPLNEEWEIKCGVERLAMNAFLKTKDNGDAGRLIECSYDLKYLHQLQNLYYDLHREDLTIKL